MVPSKQQSPLSLFLPEDGGKKKLTFVRHHRPTLSNPQTPRCTLRSRDRSPADEKKLRCELPRQTPVAAPNKTGKLCFREVPNSKDTKPQRMVKFVPQLEIQTNSDSTQILQFKLSQFSHANPTLISTMLGTLTCLKSVVYVCVGFCSAIGQKRYMIYMYELHVVNTLGTSENETRIRESKASNKAHCHHKKMQS